MTMTTKNGGAEDSEDIRAAEFVLGVLDAAEHSEMAERVASEPALRSRVKFWQSSLASLDAQFEEVPAPNAVLGKIEQRLFGPSPTPAPLTSFWGSLNLWRGLAGGALAVAALAVGFSVLQPMPSTDIGPARQLVATLEAVDTDVKYLARYDSADGQIHLAALSGEPVPDHDFELWFIQGSDTPISLGVVPASGKVDVALTAEMRAVVSEGTVFAITLEPIGGGPDGKPTGPVIAAGAVNLI